MLHKYYLMLIYTMHPNQISLKSDIFKIMSKHRKLHFLQANFDLTSQFSIISHAEFDFDGFEPYFIEKTRKNEKLKIFRKILVSENHRNIIFFKKIVIK